MPRTFSLIHRRASLQKIRWGLPGANFSADTLHKGFSAADGEQEQTARMDVDKLRKWWIKWGILRAYLPVRFQWLFSCKSYHRSLLGLQVTDTLSVFRVKGTYIHTDGVWGKPVAPIYAWLCGPLRSTQLWWAVRLPDILLWGAAVSLPDWSSGTLLAAGA